MKATLSHYRQAPRKVRLLVDFVRGKDVTKAATELRFVPKRAAEPLRKLIESAAANAYDQHGYGREQLYIKTATVNEGLTFVRFMPRARGRATPLNKRTSHIHVELGVRSDQHSTAQSHTDSNSEANESSAARAETATT
jgi:large subunit ribosomal protein L22